jgi:hypothetical protein
VAAHAVAVRARARASTVGLAGGRRLGLEEPHPLVGVRGSGSWLSRLGSGCRDELRVATWGVCGPDHRARGGSTTPTRAAARDTAHPCWGDGLVAAGGADQLRGRPKAGDASNGKSSIAEDGLEQKAGLPPRRKHEEDRGGQQGESPKLGNGVTPRVLVTTRSVAEIGERHLSRGAGGTPVTLRLDGIAGSGGPQP